MKTELILSKTSKEFILSISKSLKEDLERASESNERLSAATEELATVIRMHIYTRYVPGILHRIWRFLFGQACVGMPDPDCGQPLSEQTVRSCGATEELDASSFKPTKSHKEAVNDPRKKPY